MSSEYDSNAKRNKLTEPEDGVTTYTHDVMNRVSTITNPSDDTWVYQYNSNGMKQKVINGNDTYEAYEYDDALRLIEVGNYESDDDPISLFNYEYDNADRKTKEIKNGIANTTYSYDDRGYLTGVRYPNDSVETFGYDDVGNRTKKILNEDEEETDYYYDSADQLTTTIQDATTTSFTHDDNGNLLSQDDGTNEKNFEYDLFGRLTNVDDGTDDLGTYTYNPEGTRRAATEDSVTSKFFYSGYDMIGKYNSTWDIQETYTYGSNIDEVLGKTDKVANPDVDYFFAHDGLGSIVNTTDADETLKTTYGYDAFGKQSVTYNSGTVNSQFTYTGREYSSATDNYYYRARTYNANMGRFLSRDPFPYDLTDPASIQRYNYVQNSPMNFVDPLGTYPKIVAIGTTFNYDGFHSVWEGTWHTGNFMLDQHNLDAFMQDLMMASFAAEFAGLAEAQLDHSGGGDQPCTNPGVTIAIVAGIAAVGGGILLYVEISHYLAKKKKDLEEIEKKKKKGGSTNPSPNTQFTMGIADSY